MTEIKYKFKIGDVVTDDEHGYAEVVALTTCGAVNDDEAMTPEASIEPWYLVEWCEPQFVGAIAEVDIVLVPNE